MDESGHTAERWKTLPEPSLGLDRTALEKAVLLEQIRVLYQTHAIVFVNLVNALLTAYVLRDLLPVRVFVGWIGLFSIVVLARYLDCRRYLRAPQEAEFAATWGWRFAAGATATGCFWGLTAAGILITPYPAYHAFIAFVVGGMMAGAVAGDSAFLPALIGFTVPAVLPVIFAFFARGDLMSITMGLMVAGFTAVLGLVGFRANHWIASIARREITQRALAAELESRIAERKEAERELYRSNGILQAIAASATEILRSLDFDQSIPKVLKLIGRSMGVSSAHLYANNGTANFALFMRHMWNAPGTAPMIETRNLWQPTKTEGTVSVPTFLAQGKVQFINTNEADEPIRSLLYSCGVQSFLLIPVFAGGNWWGAVGVGDGEVNRKWSMVEIGTLTTLSELIGTAITHARDLVEIADAGRIVENSLTVLYRLDPNYPYSIKYVSRNIDRYGYTRSQLLSAPDSYMDLVHPDDRPDILANITEIVAAKTIDANCDFRLRMPSGSYVWIENRMHPVRDSGGKLTALEGILIDVNDQKIAQTEAARLTYTDLLTGLPNRLAFMEWLQKAFAAAKQGDKRFAVLYLDLDDFKDINETLGHSLGDELLKAVARRLVGALREDDRIARVGGDEFAVLLSDVADRTVVATLAARIIGSITAPHSIDGSQMHVTASIGISIYRNELTKPENVMREADLALYEAKGSGRDKHVFYSEALDIAVRERVTIVEELRAALDHGEFEVYYQPQVEVPSRQIIGVEALLRWNHPSRGLLTPGHFIAIAEKTGMIGSIGQWVLAEVRRQLRIWNNEGIGPPVTGVNLSAAQLMSPADFLHDLMQGLSADRLDPSRLELELTESLLMDTSHGHGDIVNQLRAFGVRIAIDDFGTGYSSLEYLLVYRVNRIKIAQQFVNGLPSDPGSAAIVRATIGLAHEFGIEIIAEGVETAAQLEFLVGAGCPRIQGFYFSRPLPADQVTQLLRRGVLAPAAERELAAQLADCAEPEGARA
jgi:diguanylate cyclase (GGDEF)-like protein/PAS domain S-box-containing protein